MIVINYYYYSKYLKFDKVGFMLQECLCIDLIIKYRNFMVVKGLLIEHMNCN